jgi:hypothetical protein
LVHDYGSPVPQDKLQHLKQMVSAYGMFPGPNCYKLQLKLCYYCRNDHDIY